MKYSLIVAAALIVLVMGSMYQPAVVQQDYYTQVNYAKAKYEHLPVGSPGSSKVSVHYSATVIATWRHADGTIYFVAENHNILVNLGLNDSLTELFVAGSRIPWLYIQPTNASMSAVATDTYCCGGSDKTFVTTTDLAPAIGTFTATGIGTGKVARTFTLTAAVSVTVYGAGLTTSTAHGSGAANLRAEANLPSNAIMSAIGDNVQIVWYIQQT